MGAAVHQVLELLLKGDNSLKRSYKKAAIDCKLTTSEVEMMMEHGDSIQAFIDRTDKFKQSFDVTKVLIEHRFALTHRWGSATFFDNSSMVRGVFDYALVLGDGRAIIIDHKTGKPKPIAGHKDQLDLYSLAGLLLFPEIESIQCAIHYTSTGDLDWGTTVKRSQLEGLKEWYLSFMEDKTARIAGGEYTPNDNWLCGFCGYHSDCPQWSSTHNGEEDK